MEIATLTASGLSRSAFIDSPFKALSLEMMVLFLYHSFFRRKAWSKMDWVFPLEPGVGVEPTLAIRRWMFTTGCYEPRLQPVALSDRPSVDKPPPAEFDPRQQQVPDPQSYNL